MRTYIIIRIYKHIYIYINICMLQSQKVLTSEHDWAVHFVIAVFWARSVSHRFCLDQSVKEITCFGDKTCSFL